MKKILCILLTLATLLLMLVSCQKNELDDGMGGDITTTSPAPEVNVPYETTDEVTDLVIIDVRDYGKIVVELYPETAPITVDNFKKLVSEKFYDGLIFHRIIKGFMIQGGGLTPEYAQRDADTIKGEFSSNGVENELLHTKGVISMARTPDPDSASSQFFIMHDAAPHLDGDYAAFGKTVFGIDVVDAIASVATNYSDMPLSEVVIESIRFAVAID